MSCHSAMANIMPYDSLEWSFLDIHRNPCNSAQHLEARAMELHWLSPPLLPL